MRMTKNPGPNQRRTETAMTRGYNAILVTILAISLRDMSSARGGRIGNRPL